MQTLPHTRFTRSFSLMIVIIAYLISYAFAAFSIVLLKDVDWHPLWKMAVADAVGTLIIYFFSVGFKNSSFYDAYWSVAPAVFLIFLIPLANNGVDGFRQLLVSMAVLVWAIRLTLNWARHWEGIKMEDWRYVKLKQKGGFSAFIADFFGIHFFPSFMVFMACLPLYPALVDSQGELTVFDLLAFAVCISAVAIEIIADEQVHLFKKRITEPGEFMKSGIWKYSRHPNYFGEWLFWVGIYLMGLLANNSYWWTGIGMLLILCLFLFASIPLMDERMKSSRPEYAEHMKKVSGFFPFPHR
jgi:steroid 5-alpha reductase family enzyme